MITLLEDLWSVFANLPAYVTFAVEEVINAVFGAFQAVLEGVAAVLPSLPATVPPPEYVETLNWFVPVVALLGIGFGLLASYILWLGMAWAWRKFGAL